MVVSDAEHHWTGIVLAGMARVYLTTLAGRQVTLRHARPGSSIGIGAVLGDAGVNAQAVTDCHVLALDTERMRSLAQRHSSLALAIGQELSARLTETYLEIVIREQGTLRQRLARQLLHFAGEIEPEQPMVLPMSHEALADAVGSTREVVSRHLQRFQSERVLELRRGHIRLVDPVSLLATVEQGD